jgi:hypothetical protein
MYDKLKKPIFNGFFYLYFQGFTQINYTPALTSGQKMLSTVLWCLNMTAAAVNFGFITLKTSSLSL